MRVGRRCSRSFNSSTLSELYKSRPQLFEIASEFARFRQLLRCNALFSVERLLEATLLHEIGAAVFHEQPRDLAVAVQVLWFQRNAHREKKMPTAGVVARPGASETQLKLPAAPFPPDPTTKWTGNAGFQPAGRSFQLRPGDGRDAVSSGQDARAPRPLRVPPARNYRAYALAIA